MPSSQFPRLYDANQPQQSRVQDNIQGVLGPVAQALQRTPIMGAPPPAWQALALATGWRPFPATAADPFPLPSCHKDALGYVHTRVVASNVSGGILPVGTLLWTYPVGLRPSAAEVATGDDALAFFSATVRPNGTVVTRQAVAAGAAVTLCFTHLAEQ